MAIFPRKMTVLVHSRPKLTQHTKNTAISGHFSAGGQKSQNRWAPQPSRVPFIISFKKCPRGAPQRGEPQAGPHKDCFPLCHPPRGAPKTQNQSAPQPSRVPFIISFKKSPRKGGGTPAGPPKDCFDDKPRREIDVFWRPAVLGL